MDSHQSDNDYSDEEEPIAPKKGCKRRSSSGSSKSKRQRRRKRMLTGVSKQRRAANERERKRLQIINDAFKNLKSILPLFPGEENISKIEIVKLASRTIQYLSEIVRKKDTDSGDLLEEMTSFSSGGCSHSACSSCDSCCDDSLPDPSELSPVHFEPSDQADDLDVNFLLSSSDDTSKTLEPTDSGLDVPSPTDSSSSSKDAFDGLDFKTFVNNMDDDLDPSMTSPDDAFYTSPSMLFW